MGFDGGREKKPRVELGFGFDGERSELLSRHFRAGGRKPRRFRSPMGDGDALHPPPLAARRALTGIPRAPSRRSRVHALTVSPPHAIVAPAGFFFLAFFLFSLFSFLFFPPLVLFCFVFFRYLFGIRYLLERKPFTRAISRYG